MKTQILFLNILLLMLSVGVKANSSFTFTEIVDTKNDFSGDPVIANHLGMNNKGEVAFTFRLFQRLSAGINRRSLQAGRFPFLFSSAG